jgi:hypothetical protein
MHRPSYKFNVCTSQRCQWLRCDMHSWVNDSAEIFSKFASHSQSDFWWVFYLKLWIHEIWEVSLWFVLIGFTPNICYIKGVEPRVKPEVWRPKIGLSCDSAVTAVSMTPLCMSQQCQWLRWTFIKICIDAQRCQRLHCACHSGLNDSAVHVTAVSMTPLCKSQRCQWHRCATYFSDFLGEY